MKSRRIGLIIGLVLVLGIGLFYVWPPPHASFATIYAGVSPDRVQALQSFRQAHPPHQIRVDGKTWEYLVAGEGPQTIVFLHGMTGYHDIWWQQIQGLEDRYRILSITYPPVSTLEAMARGIMTVLEQENVTSFTVVGTSLGGYLAQYLMAQFPERIERAVFSNTFPPNDIIEAKNSGQARLLTILPEWVVRRVFLGNFQRSIYPTSGYDAFTLAMLNEIGYQRVTKAHLLARYDCIVQKFTPASAEIPVLIIESDNDPLVELALREQLKATYPQAQVYSFHEAGHFPYLNHPEEYTRLLAAFLDQP